jgi:hypothetical protein
MGRLSKHSLLVGLGLALVLAYQAPSGGQPSPEHCTRCYKKLQQDNEDCRTLKGQDWQICREAAATAYQRCSKGC